MKAAVLYDVGAELSVEDIDLEAPRMGEVRVRIAAAGVCHSDYHVVTGDLRSPLPVILGHEGAGVVDAVGPGVTEVAPGDHVVLLIHVACGRCEFCASGQPILCSANWTKPGGLMYDGTTRLRGARGEIHNFAGVSCFAEFAVVSTESVVKIPEDVPFEVAALLGCAAVTGVGAVTNTAQVRPGRSVLVLGAGGIGLSAVMGAHLSGAYPIIVSDVVPAKLELARELGATHIVDVRSDKVLDAVAAITEGRGVDYAFDAAGAPLTTEESMHALGNGGTAVLIGAVQPRTISIVPREFLGQEKTLKGCNYGSTSAHRDIPALLRLHRGGRLPLEKLVARRYGLQDINASFASMIDGEVARSVIVF